MAAATDEERRRWRRRRRFLRSVAIIAVAASVAFSLLSSRWLSGVNLSKLLGDHASAPASVATRTGAHAHAGAEIVAAASASRRRCQIVYVMGVEGSTHHGFVPIVEALARHQVDPAAGGKYAVDAEPRALKAGLFGWFRGKYLLRWGFRVGDVPEVEHPALDTRLIEWASFPSGHEDDPRSYRVRRQREWRGMTPEEIADSDEARRHPANMTAFVHAYSPYASVKFVVLHRPFLETIASHRQWDGGPEIHSNIIRGFMLLLRGFLDDHPGLWTLVCIDRIMGRHYSNKEDVLIERMVFLANLAKFMGWPDGKCPQCFDRWRESRNDPALVLGPTNVEMLTEHAKLLEGRWPPQEEKGAVNQQCKT
ncbi:hypothetical protein ACHAWF_002338 [Thalassiosira exigua]